MAVAKSVCTIMILAWSGAKSVYLDLLLEEQSGQSLHCLHKEYTVCNHVYSDLHSLLCHLNLLEALLHGNSSKLPF